MKNYISILVLLTTGLAFSQVELEQSEIQTSDIEYQFLTEEYGSKNNFSMLEGYHPCLARHFVLYFSLFLFFQKHCFYRNLP